MGLLAIPRVFRVAVVVLQLVPALFTALPQGAFLCVQAGRLPHFEVAGNPNLSEVDTPGHHDECCPEPEPRGSGHCSDVRLTHGSATTSGGHVICPAPATPAALIPPPPALTPWIVVPDDRSCQSLEAGPDIPPLGHSLPLRI